MPTFYKKIIIILHHFVVFCRYKIKIVAHNDLGEANVAAEEVAGYSGEDVPTDAPTNLLLNEVVGPRSAILSWDPVKPESVRGDFKVNTHIL